MKSALIASLLAIGSARAATSGCTKTTTSDGIVINVCGSINGNAGSGSGTANIPGIGNVNFAGSADGIVNREEGFAIGAINGQFSGNGFSGAGAAHGGVVVNGNDINAEGAINGILTVDGETITGAAQGKVHLDGDTKQISGDGAVNGCWVQKNGLTYCYNGQGKFIGILQNSKIVEGILDAAGVFQVKSTSAVATTSGSDSLVGYGLLSSAVAAIAALAF